MPKQSKKTVSPPKRSKVSQGDFPAIALPAAIRIAQAIWDNFAGKGAAPHDIALSIDMSPTSSAWRMLCGASIAYGLTEGGYNASEITLAALGGRCVAPTEDGDDVAARAEATLKPRILNEFFSKYNRSKLPGDTVGQNVLVTMGVPKERTPHAFDILVQNGRDAGFIRDTKTGPFVALDVNRPTVAQGNCEQIPDNGHKEVEGETEQAAKNERTASIQQQAGSQRKQLFVAHGKNHKPLEALKKILNEFKIPYRVAIDEPNRGRPISGKVAQLMNDCSAGIFIFTKDEEFLRKKDQALAEIWRPSENVVYELGAANILWDKKIIILREDGVNFPSDFNDLGYITFKNGEVENKALEILKELVALELVTVSAS